MIKMSKEMSEKAFNEIVDGFEYIRTLTEWGSKNIKQHIQRLQQENKHQKEVIDRIDKYIKPLITNRDDEQYYAINWYNKDVLLDILKEATE